MSLVIIAILFLSYVAFLVYLIIKLRDIFLHNDKYDKIKGWEKYRKSFWYEHGLNYKKNYWAPIITHIPMNGIIIGLSYLFAVLIQKYLLAPVNSLAVFRTETYYIGFIGLIFFTIYFSFWISYNSKIPILVASTRTAFNSKSRGGDWKKLIVSLVIATFVALPLYILSVDNYGYVTDDKLIYNPYLSFSEENYDYDDITNVSTSFSFSDDEKKLQFSYIITNSIGQSLDVAEGGSNVVLLVNGFLQGKDVVFQKGVIGKATYMKLLNRCSLETIRMIDSCYIIS